MNYKPEQIPIPEPSLIWRVLDDGLVIVSPQIGKVRVLNEVATTIWQLISENHSIAFIENHLVDNYAISSEKAAADLQQFLTELTDKGLLLWEN